MNKIAYAAAGAAALLVAGLPPVLGLVTEAQVRARVAALSQSGIWTGEVRSFERGWFRGRAKIELTLSRGYARRLSATSAARGAPDIGSLLGRRTPLDVAFAYGPIVLSDGVHFGLSRMVARPDPESGAIAGLQRSLAVPHLFELRGSTGFLGKLTFDADVPPIDVAMGSMRVQFSGALVDGSLFRNHLVANGRIDRFEFSSPTGVFTVGNVVGRVDNEIRSPYVLPGKAGLVIERISIVDAARSTSPVFDAKTLRADSQIRHDERSNLLEIESTYTLASAFVDGGQIDDATLSLAFRKIDAGALAAYAEAMRALPSGAVARDALRALRPLLERALAAGPSIALDPVSFRYDGEPFAGRVEIMTNTAALPRPGGVDFEDPAVLLELFDSAADVELSKKLARELTTLAIRTRYGGDPTVPPGQLELLAQAQSGQFLFALVGQGLLTSAGDDYRAELRVTQGAVTVNGAPLPFSGP